MPLFPTLSIQQNITKKKQESWKIIKGVMRFLFLVVVLCTSEPYLILLYKYEGLRFNIIA